MLEIPSASPAEVGSAAAGSEKATKHLCAGVYLDREFRELIIRRVHNDSRRRVAPSYGFDLVPVVRHAWYAWAFEMFLYLSVISCAVLCLLNGGLLALFVGLCTSLAFLNLGKAYRAWVAMLDARQALREEERERKGKTKRHLDAGKTFPKERKRLKIALISTGASLVAAPIVADVFAVSLWWAAKGCPVITGLWR